MVERSGTMRDGIRAVAGPAASTPVGVAAGLAIVTASIATTGYAVRETPALYARVSEPCTDDLCAVFEQPNAQTRHLLDALGMTVTGWALVVVVSCWLLLALAVLVALAIARLVPGRAVTVVTAMVALVTGAVPFAEGADRRALLVAIGVLVPVFVGLFPTGRWVPRWARFLWPAAALATVALQLSASPGVLGVGVLAFVIGVPVYRFTRVADWTTRQQMSWPLLGILTIVVTQCLGVVAAAGGWLEYAQVPLVALDYLGIALLLAGLGLGLLRHRLYDVQVLVRRATLYTVTVGALAVLYLLALAVAGQLAARTAAANGTGLVVATVAVVGLVLALAGRRVLQRHVLGPAGRSVVAARALARDALTAGDTTEEPAATDSIASTIAGLVEAPHVVVRDAAGELVSTHGAATEIGQEVAVVGAEGVTLGSVALGVPPGRRRLSRRDRLLLNEVQPFLAVALGARHEATVLLELRRQVSTSRAEERRRLRADLHDGVGPLLASQLLQLDMLRSELGTDHDRLLRIEGTTRDAIAEVRRLSRDLLPEALVGADLTTALGVTTQRFVDAGFPVRLQTDLGARPLPIGHQVALLRIVQESLSNAARHSGAGACEVLLAGEDDHVALTVTDDGRGFADRAVEGAGLPSMRGRVLELGGSLTLTSEPGQGTRVEARLPW